jgi:hypothetical protein
VIGACRLSLAGPSATDDEPRERTRPFTRAIKQRNLLGGEMAMREMDDAPV